MKAGASGNEGRKAEIMSQRPNILFVMTDQQRSDTIRALGNQEIRTPVLDSLVEQGNAFTNCYTPSPVCVAARSATITGVPPHLNGCTSNNESPFHLPSMMQVLQEAGYRTHGIAQMHFHPQVDAMWGFDSRDISEEGARRPQSRNDFHDYLSANGYEHVLEPHGMRSEMYYVPQPSQLPAKHHHTTWVADRAIDFLVRDVIVSSHFSCGQVSSNRIRHSKRQCPGTSFIERLICSRRIGRKASKDC